MGVLALRCFLSYVITISRLVGCLYVWSVGNNFDGGAGNDVVVEVLCGYLLCGASCFTHCYLFVVCFCAWNVGNDGGEDEGVLVTMCCRLVI